MSRLGNRRLTVNGIHRHRRILRIRRRLEVTGDPSLELPRRQALVSGLVDSLLGSPVGRTPVLGVNVPPLIRHNPQLLPEPVQQPHHSRRDRVGR